MNQSLSDALEPIAAAFRSLGTPEPIVHRKFGSETPSFYDGFTVKY
jgi:hypothetical protein